MSKAKGTSNDKSQTSLEDRVRALEAELEKAKQDLKDSKAELVQFAYVASHDLQEPLRMVSSYLQLLTRRAGDKLDKDANEFIDFAVDGATRMQGMIQALLTYSRVNTKGKPFEPTDCEAVFSKALANLQTPIQNSGAEVTHDPLPTIVADEAQMAQLIQNLIDNGVKFHNEEQPKVHVSAKEQGDDWLFAVRDNGIGIDPEFHERIFEVFARLHGKQDYKGTGIGLSVCKKIVERHSGSIWVESEPGKGATFYFTIPKNLKEGGTQGENG